MEHGNTDKIGLSERCGGLCQMLIYRMYNSLPGVESGEADRALGFLYVQYAAMLLGQGELVAFPTETVYGLGANAFSDEAVAKIFTAKGRPRDNPLIVHIGSKDDLRRVAATWPPVAEMLIDRFWPGPLTLVLPRRPGVSALVSAGLPTVAVRMPDHPVALKLLTAAGLPIAAPSANRSGRPSPTRAEHVATDLDEYVAALLDSGPTREGVESTVLDLSSTKPRILRPGSITREMLAPLLPNLETDLASDDAAPRSPGQKYDHYAPRAPLYLYHGDRIAVRRRIEEDANMWQRTNRKVALLLSEPVYNQYLADIVLDLAEGTPTVEAILPGTDRLRSPQAADADQDEFWQQRLAGIAGNLYHALRMCDNERVGIILVQGVEPQGLGEAIMNRLAKAARDVIYLP